MSTIYFIAGCLSFFGFMNLKTVDTTRNVNVLSQVIPQFSFTTNERGENEWHFHLFEPF